MNNVKLTDFSKETLSDVAATLSLRLDQMDNSNKYKEYPNLRRKEDLMEFRAQCLYAFSVVKEREKLMNQ